MDQDAFAHRLAHVASAIADRTRASMLCVLMDGRAYTATELSVVAEVAPSTASEHLAQLVACQLLKVTKQGRRRYYHLHDPDVATALETLMGLAHREPSSLRSSTPRNLRFARTCYDHLAGKVAVAIYDRMLALSWLDVETSMPTEAGRRELKRMGLVMDPGACRRRYSCPCMDWSERRPHLGGYLGHALLTRFDAYGWMERAEEGREVRFTRKGKAGLKTWFALDLAMLE